MVIATISTLSDKGASPTEIEMFIKKLQGHFDNNTNLKINVSPLKSKKLDEKVIAKIKGLWKEIESKSYRLKKYEFYALVYRAMEKLRFSTDGKRVITRVDFSQLFGLRRPTLCTYYNKTVDTRYDETYLDIERMLYTFPNNVNPNEDEY
jgi:hypothetical protein